MSDTGVRLYNTLTKHKEPLETGPDGTVRIYVCGPTVYSRVHIGNARPFVVFSVLKRYLSRRGGLRVVFASNLTDINDKIYEAAHREGRPSDELAEFYGQAYIDDTNRLGLGRPDLEPTVTQTMPQIIALIGDLVDKGLAYAAGGDVYFRVDSFPGYGKLSGRKTDEMVSTDPGEAKESPLDFALWKGKKADEDTCWDSPWGPGRPGWHIECSAMAETLLGNDFEIHGGGIDLIFPHHENEIAQTEGARDERFAKIWMHNEMLELGGEKMAKSVGNIASLEEVLDAWPPEVILAFFLTSHYRSKLPFTEERMLQAKEWCDRLRNALRALDRAIESPGEGADQELAATLVTARSDFFAALDDDFNTPEAFAVLAELVRATNASIENDRPGADQLREARHVLVELLDVFGLATLDRPDELPAEVLDMARRRDEARAARDFAEADALRDEITGLGFEVRDTPEGTQVYRA